MDSRFDSQFALEDLITTEQRRMAVLALKNNWRLDPCWDIKDTSGFEDVKDELREYRIECEREWRENARQKLIQKANELGALEHLDLVAYIMQLEFRLTRLEGRLNEIEA